MKSGVGVEAATLSAVMPTGAIRESATCLLNEKDPWSVIPNLPARKEAAINLASNELDQCSAPNLRVGRRQRCFARKARTTHVVSCGERCIVHFAGRADAESSRRTSTWPP